MIPPTPEHPQPRSDAYCTMGISPTSNLQETIAELHGHDPGAGWAVHEIDPLLTTPAFRQARWFRAFHQNVLTAVSILYPHANARAQVKMAQEYLDDLAHGGYLRTLDLLAASDRREHLSFARESGESRSRPGQTNREEMKRFSAVCKALLIVLLRTCWKLAGWCLYHGLRIPRRLLAWLYPIIVGQLKRWCLIPKDGPFTRQHHAPAGRFPPRRGRRHRRQRSSAAGRRFQRR